MLRSQPPKPQQDFFFLIPTRQAKADSPVRRPAGRSPRAGVLLYFLLRPAGHGAEADARMLGCWRSDARARASTPSRASSPPAFWCRHRPILTAGSGQAQHNAHTGGHGAGHTTWLLRGSRLLGARPGAAWRGAVQVQVQMANQARQCRVRASGFTAIWIVSGGRALPCHCQRGRCAAARAAGASCMHATQAASSMRNKGPVIQLNWNRSRLRCVHATVATFDAPYLARPGRPGWLACCSC